MRKLTKRSAAIVTGSVLAVAGGTAAFAYASGWFQGSSTTYAATSSIGELTAFVDLRLQATNTNNMKLYPGKLVELKNVTVNNPNDFKVKIASIDTITVTNGGDCTQSEAGFTFPELNTSVVFDKGETTNVDLGDIKMAETATTKCAGQGGLIIKATLKGDIAG